MSLPPQDFRCGLPEEIDIWLEAEAVATGKKKTDLVREILSEWAKQRAHAYRLAAKRIKEQRVKLESAGGESGE